MAGKSLVQWEQAEVERSRVQATLSANITATRRDIFERYSNPPPDTAFPLEYLFHVVGDVRGRQVLDYGCGDGGDSTLLAARGAFVQHSTCRPTFCIARRVDSNSTGWITLSRCTAAPPTRYPCLMPPSTW